MWFEIIPSLAIVTVSLTIPSIVAYFGHKLVQKGNPYRRDINTYRQDLALYQRDVFFGNPYVRRGLENIPDN